MPVTETVDEVVHSRTAAVGGAPAQRPTISETVDGATGASIQTRAGVEEESVSELAGAGRKMKESTVKLLEKLSAAPAAPAAGAGEPIDTDDVDVPDDAAADEAAAPAADTDAGETSEEAAADEEAAPDVVKEWQEKATRLEASNRSLVAELEGARKTPKVERSEREQALLDAESTYVDEGSVKSLRKFIGVVIGAAPDSNEVTSELSGLYADLTALEVGVPLDENQQARRENARTRLLLSRDKREKAETEKKPQNVNSDETAQIANAARYVDNLVVTKVEGGTSIAEEFPRLMALAEHFDGMSSSELIARAVKREIQVGTLDPKTMTDVDMLRAVASKIDKHYAGIISKADALTKKPDTTKPSVKPQAAPVKTSKEGRQSQGAPTITNATASVAPAKPPKAKTTQTSTGQKSRKDFPTDSAWREHLLNKHIPG